MMLREDAGVDAGSNAEMQVGKTKFQLMDRVPQAGRSGYYCLR